MVGQCFEIVPEACSDIGSKPFIWLQFVDEILTCVGVTEVHSKFDVGIKIRLCFTYVSNYYLIFVAKEIYKLASGLLS